MKEGSSRHSSDEVERIRDVYSGYGDFAATKWARSNAGNRAMLQERNAVIADLLGVAGKFPPRDLRILDIGCGEGELLGLMSSWGAGQESCFGVDLLPERIAIAREKFPLMTFSVANAERLDFPSASFDVITLFTVFSSILAPEMSVNLAREVGRLLRPQGCVLIYDFRVPSLWNRNTRSIRRSDLRSLFSDYEISSHSLTVLPPLARRMGSITATAYPLLASLPLLRTHNLSLLRYAAKKGSRTDAATQALDAV
ncbi:MAG: class I SAM-dependent methyltransferase [Bryobacterales bacterium]|nr:class I SAM-dependent methyltransferase [Bryobacterales bacterium]